jgi:hypothetical protein
VAYSGALAHGPRMETETDVGTLRFQCPRTSREVDSGIDTDRDTRFLTRLFSIRVRCPMCGDLHEWRVAAGRPPRGLAVAAKTSTQQAPAARLQVIGYRRQNAKRQMNGSWSTS